MRRICKSNEYTINITFHLYYIFCCDLFSIHYHYFDVSPRITQGRKLLTSINSNQMCVSCSYVSTINMFAILI